MAVINPLIADVRMTSVDCHNQTIASIVGFAFKQVCISPRPLARLEIIAEARDPPVAVTRDAASDEGDDASVSGDEVADMAA